MTILREAGISACPRCAAIHSGDDRFCPNCGLSMSRRVDLPVAGAPAPWRRLPAPRPRRRPRRAARRPASFDAPPVVDAAERRRSSAGAGARADAAEQRRRAAARGRSGCEPAGESNACGDDGSRSGCGYGRRGCGREAVARAGEGAAGSGRRSADRGASASGARRVNAPTMQPPAGEEAPVPVPPTDPEAARCAGRPWIPIRTGVCDAVRRLARGCATAPNWKAPLVVLAVIAALALAVLAVALVKLAGKSNSNAPAGHADVAGGGRARDPGDQRDIPGDREHDAGGGRAQDRDRPRERLDRRCRLDRRFRLDQTRHQEIGHRR